MFDFLDYSFMIYALIGATLISFLASYYGVFVVERQMSFLGSGLAHAAFGGIALGLLLNIEPLIIAVPFTIIVALGITWVKEETQLSGDTTIGIFFAVSMALGIIFLYLKDNYTADAMTFLFGSILAIKKFDLYAAGFMSFVTLLTFPMWKRWAYATFDKELARTDRLPVLRDDYLLSVLIAMTVVISIKLVGIVMIAAFLVIPPATSRLLSHSFRWMTILAVLISLISAYTGLMISYYRDLPSGATIILVESVFFIFAAIYNKIQNK